MLNEQELWKKYNWIIRVVTEELVLRGPWELISWRLYPDLYCVFLRRDGRTVKRCFQPMIYRQGLVDPERFGRNVAREIIESCGWRAE